MGMAFTKELETGTAEAILEERQENGAFMSFDNFLKEKSH